MNTTSKASLWTLLPFGIFIVVFLGAGIYYGDFYVFPSPVAISIGVISAFIILKGSIRKKTDTFLKGCGDSTILKMCLIYLLAGAFATVSEAIGSTGAIVDLGINQLSPEYFPAGIFLVAAFLSIASGTSVGTIVALGPIVVGLSTSSGIDINLLGAALLGGALFGDNLSVISDTTIAATQIMGCKMGDKFKNNIRFALPAALITFLLYIFIGVETPEVIQVSQSFDIHALILTIPYLVVLALAFAGLDVFLVLVIGIVFSGVLGFVYQDFTFLTFGQEIYEGFTGMTEIFLLSLLTGGLAAMIEQAGGINSLLEQIKKLIRGRKSALLGIGTFVGLTDMATANNTISIIISGKIAQKITTEYHIRRRVTASILDTFSCIVQGIIPYGAQILILTSYSKNTIDYPQLIGNNFYIFFLLIAVIIYIFVGKTKNQLGSVQNELS